MILIALAVLAANPATSTTPVKSSPTTPTTPVATTSPGTSGGALAANPSTLASVFTAAHPGDTIRLVAGRYPSIAFRNRTFNPAITIDASAATMTMIQMRAVSGVHWTGGTIDGSVLTVQTGADFGILAANGTDVTVTGVHFTSLLTGVVFDHITGGEVSNNWFTKMRADGIDIAVSRSIKVANNSCSDFTPGAGSHPDCIQAWSKPTDPPTADITVTGNSAIGTMQGISFFDSIVNGVSDGGFDRVSVSGNTVVNIYGNGIALHNCRGCSAHNNVVNSLPNYLYRAQLYVTGGSVDQCGNTVVMVPRQSTPPCRD